MVNTQNKSCCEIDAIALSGAINTAEDMKWNLYNLSRLAITMMEDVVESDLDLERASWLCNFLAEQFEVQSDRADFLMGELMNAMKRGAR